MESRLVATTMANVAATSDGKCGADDDGVRGGDEDLYDEHEQICPAPVEAAAGALLRNILWQKR